MGLSLIILDVTSGGDIEAAFATLAARGADSLLVEQRRRREEA
jgi:hypothetical protein